MHPGRPESAVIYPMHYSQYATEHRGRLVA